MIMRAQGSDGDGGCDLVSPASLSRAELATAWMEAYGRQPPKGIGTRLLMLAEAYHRQAHGLGKLRPETCSELLKVVDRQEERSSAPKQSAPTGTRFIREWHGEAHVVDVLKDGVLYRGETFRSLSQVARKITGAKWSGPRFFGAVGR